MNWPFFPTILAPRVGSWPQARRARPPRSRRQRCGRLLRRESLRQKAAIGAAGTMEEEDAGNRLERLKLRAHLRDVLPVFA